MVVDNVAREQGNGAVTLGAGGVQKKTLRFPRVLKGPKSTKGLRVKRLELGIDGDEKPWYDCMRVSEFQALDQRENKSAIQRPKSPEKKAKRGAVVLGSQKFTEFKGEKISEALAGYKVWVLPCKPEHKQKAERQAAQLGATVMASDPADIQVSWRFLF